MAEEGTIAGDMRLGSRTVLPADTRGFEMPAAGVLLASMLLLAWIGGLGCSEEVSRVATPPEAPGATRSLDPRAPTNVVIISMDTTRADALGAYGQKLPTSPEIDRLAEEGVLFEQCVTSSPSTLPSHVSILTGKQPYSHGVRSNGGYVLADAIVTLAEVLRSHGYATGAEIAATVISAQTQLDQGFDQYHDTAGNGTRDQKHAERSGQDITRGGIEFIRTFSWGAYEIPPDQVVGSSAETEFHQDGDQSFLMRLPELHFNDDKEGKPIAINRYIGQRPIAAFGNSDGDLQMLQYAAGGDGARLMVLVHHTDAEREYAYDRDSRIGRLDKALDEANARGWTVVSMKDDWRRVFPWEN